MASNSEGLDVARKLDRITINPAVMNGQPCIRGMRMRVVDILQMLAGGMTTEEILADFDFLEADDVRASILYAANLLDRHIILRAAE